MNSICLIFICISIIVCTYGQSCEDFESADGCMQKIQLIGDPELQFPINNQQMDRHCGSIAGNEKCVKDYSQRCLQPMARHITNILVNSAVKSNRGYCTNPVRRQAFLRVGQCTNVRKTSLDQLMYAFIDTLEAIDTFEQKSMKIPLLCCNYKRFKSALIKETRNEKQPKCSEPVVEEFDHLIDGFGNEVLSLICPKEYSEEGSDKCETIIPLTPQYPSTESRPKSMLMPLVNIFNSLKN